jgi:hypothetical protein
MTDEQTKSLRSMLRARRRWRRRAVWSGLLLVLIFMMNAADRTTAFPHWRVAALRWIPDATGGRWDGRLLDDPSSTGELAAGEVAVYMGRHSEERVLGILKQNTYVWTYGVHSINAPMPDLPATLLPVIARAKSSGNPTSDYAAGLHERLQYGWLERINWPHAFFVVLSIPLLGLCFHATRLGFGGPGIDERPAARA